MKHRRGIIAIAAIATSLVVAAPASAAAYIPRSIAIEEAMDLARDVYLDGDAVDWGWDDCERHSSRRVSCYAVVDWDHDENGYEDYQCSTRVTVTARKYARGYATTYGRPDCYETDE